MENKQHQKMISGYFRVISEKKDINYTGIIKFQKFKIECLRWQPQNYKQVTL